MMGVPVSGTKRAWVRRSGVALVLALGACVCSCRTAAPVQPELPAEEIEALRRRQAEAATLFGEALELAESPAEQKELYLRIIELDPSLGKAHNNLGLAYLEGEEYGEAIRFLREAAKRLPASAEPRFNLGYAYELIGRLESAEEQYYAAVKLNGEEPDYLEGLARVYIRRRDHLGKARGLLETSLRLETRPDHVAWIKDQLALLRSGMIP